MEIQIRKIIMHIIDQNVQMPVIATKELFLDDEINDFAQTHISKSFTSAETKQLKLKNHNWFADLCLSLRDEPSRFCTASAEIAKYLFDFITKNISIPSADVMFTLFEAEGTLYFGLLKFNYKTSYIHHVFTNDNEIDNKIIKQITTLPNPNQKIEECVFVNLNTFEAKVIEKKYEINGENLFYLSTNMLGCEEELSQSQKVKSISKVTEKFVKKYYDEDIKKPIEIKKAITENLEETQSVDIDRVADQLFHHAPDLKNEYLIEVQKAGFKERVIELENPEMIEKKYKKQRIKTDSGIEINLPVDLYNNRDTIEFINNPDGTVSILIKNIRI